MKIVRFTLIGIGLITVLGSCVGISHVTDDDVYLIKNPVLPVNSEITDESSYENYRYRQNREDFDVYYGNSPNLWAPQMHWSAAYGSGLYYSPYNNCSVYGYGYHAGYAAAYGCYNYGGYGNPFGNPYSPYYNPYYNPYAPFSPYSGVGYGYNYNNFYGYNSYSETASINSTSINQHFKPRNSSAGINNSRRPVASGMAGMAIQKSSNSGTISAPELGNRRDKQFQSQPISSSQKSRPVQQGTGLSKSGNVSTTPSEARRSSAGQTSSRPSNSGQVNSERKPSSRPTGTGGNTSRPANVGGSKGGNSPSPAPKGTSGRRGG